MHGVPNLVPKRESYSANGVWLMFSAPPASTISASPTRIYIESRRDETLLRRSR